MASHRWRVEPDSKLSLSRIDTRSTAGAPGDKQATKAATDVLRARLVELQAKLYAEHAQNLLVVFQAIDTGGKDGTIRSVLSGVNPAGVEVTSFKRPTEDELSHDFLWRVHRAAPGKGHIGVFNRSHYEDVLVARVHRLVPQAVWRERFEHIRAFEANLAAAGTRVVKVFLHISKEEQAERLRSRLEDPAKHWKFEAGDLEERKLWREYQQAFRDALAATSTEAAPWFVVPADRKWYRDWAVTKLLVEALEDMDPQFPPAPEGLEDVVVS